MLIYPQQTKYIATQKDPFSVLFNQFRQQLNTSKDQALAICGYSFGDDHVNLEIETALDQPGNNTTLICFVAEQENPDNQTPELPKILDEWLSEKPWSVRVFVLTDRGLYWGSTTNRFELVDGTHDWWTFAGVSNLLVNGI